MVPTESYALPQASLNHLEPESIEFEWGLRRVVVQQTEIFSEQGKSLAAPITQISASAIVRNPWVANDADPDLIKSPQHIAARLSKLLSDRILAVTGGVEAIEAFGKGAIIGEAGELEHGAALTHTPYFASHLRSFLGGSAVISFSDIRGAAGESLVIPLCEKSTGIVRDYYQSVRVRIPDAPLPNEIVLVAAASTGPRPFPRVGDRTADLPLDTSSMNGVFE